MQSNQLPVFSSPEGIEYKCPRCKTFTRYTHLLHLVEFKKNGPVRTAVRYCPSCADPVIPEEGS